MVSSTPANPPAHPQAQVQPQSSLFQDVHILADEDWPVDEWHERCHILVPFHLHRSVLILDSCTSACVSGDLLSSSEAPPSSPSASASASAPAPASGSPSPSVATSALASSPFLDGDRVMDVLSHEGFWAEGNRAVFRRRVDVIMALAPNPTVFPRVTTLTPDGPPPPAPADDTPVVYIVRSLEPAGSVAMDLGWRVPVPLRVGDAVFVDWGRDEVLTGAGYVVDKYDVDPDSVARMFARLGRPVPGTARRKRDDTDKKDDTDKDAKNDKNDPPPPSSGTGTGEPSNNEPGPNTTASSAKHAPDHYPSLTSPTTITAATKTTADAQAQHVQSDALNPPEGAVPLPEGKPEDNPEGKVKELPIVIQSLGEAFLENRRRIEQEPIPVRPPVRRRREVVLHPDGMVFTDRDRELADMWVLMK